MAKNSRELLVTLGADTTTFAQKIKRAKDLTKELDSSFKLIASSSQDFENSLDGLGKKQGYLADKMKIANTLAEVYSDRLKESQDCLENLTKDSEKYADKINEIKRAMGSMEEGSDAWKEQNELLKVNQQLYDKSIKDIKTYNDRILDSKTNYNKVQTEIQHMNRELELTSEKLHAIGVNDNIKKIKKDVEELDHQFAVVSEGVKGFDNSLTGLDAKQKHINDKLKANKELMSIYNKELSSSKEVVEYYSKAVKNLSKELDEWNDLLRSMKGNEPDYEEIRHEVEELRGAYTDANRALQFHRDRVKEMGSEYKSTERDVAKLTNELGQAQNELEKFGRTKNFESLEHQIQGVSNELKILDSSFAVTESRVKIFDNTLEDLGHKKEYLSNKIQTLTSQMGNYQNSIRATETEISRLNNEQQDVARTIEQLKQKMNAPDASEQQIEQHRQALVRLESEYHELNSEINRNKNELNGLQVELNETTADMNNLSRSMATANGDFLSGQGEKFQKLGQSMQSVGQAMLPLTLGMGAFGASAIKTGVDFSAGMSEVGAVTGATGKDLEDLTDKAREMGKSTIYSATESASALKYLGLAGYDAEQAMDTLPMILQTAQAGAMDLALASDLATDSISSLGYVGEDAVKALPDYLDKVAGASTNANTSVEQLMTAYVKVGGQLDSMNISMDTSASMLGVLANRGIKAEFAGNSLNSILINMTKKTGESAKGMDALGVSMFDAEGNIRDVESVMQDMALALSRLGSDEERVNIINMIGGKTQAKTLQKLLQGMVTDTGQLTNEYKELKSEISTAPENNALEEMARTMNDNLKGDIAELKSAWQELQLTFMDASDSGLRNMTQDLTELVNKISDAFESMSPQMQEFVIQFGLITAIIPPLIIGFGMLAEGFGAIMAFAGWVAGKLGLATVATEGVAGAVAGAEVATVGFGGALSAIGGALTTVASTVLPYIAGVLAVLAIAFGDNTSAIQLMQDKFGDFGTFVMGVGEMIGGVFEGIFKQFGNLASGIGQTVGTIFSDASMGEKAKSIGKIWKKTTAKMSVDNAHAWSDITATTNIGISNIKHMTENQMKDVKWAFSVALKELPELTEKNVDDMATRFARGLDRLDETTITTLRGTSSTMDMLFNDISKNMTEDQAMKQFSMNLSTMVKSGQFDITTLQKDMDSAMKIIDNNFKGSSKGIKGTAENMFKAISDSSSVDEMTTKIVGKLDNLNQSTVDELSSMGTSWKLIFDGIKVDSSMSTDHMTRLINSRIKAMAKDNPEFIKQIKDDMKTYLSQMSKDADAEGTKLAEVMKKNGVKTVEELQAGVESGKIDAIEVATALGEEIGQGLGEGATEGAKMGMADLPQSVKDELSNMGVVIDEQGQVTIEDMKANAQKAGKAYVDTLNEQLPQLSGVSKNIQTQLSGIDSIRLGNVTKQLSEVNRWLGVITQTSIETNIQMTGMTLLKLGNTTKGLSEVNNWLMRTQNRAKDTRGAMVNLTNLPFGNTTKGLSEVNNWLMRTQNRAKDTRQPLLNLTNLPFGNTTKGLSEVCRWLDSTKSKAYSASTALRSITNIGFGGVTKGLSQIVRWLDIVRNTAYGTGSAINSVSIARPTTGLEQPIEKTAMQQYTTGAGLMQEMFNTATSISEFKTSGGFYQPQSMSQQSKSSNEDSSDLKALLQATLTQNQLLLQMLGQDRPVAVAVNVDGRQIAKASAKYMETEINSINTKKNRLGGKF